MQEHEVLIFKRFFFDLLTSRNVSSMSLTRLFGWDAES
ncbi:Unknown protein sequence [Pseudomonas amygdali pv. sesami]|nr:Unknown protein sequence [Pseudomonas amygdali pv. sesami]